MERAIKFNFVYSNCALQIKEFLSNVPKKAECINYIEILNKLTRNDYMQEEPSDVVVASYLIKQINSTMSKHDLSEVYYVLNNIDQETLQNVKNHVMNLTHLEINFGIYTLSEQLELSYKTI